MYRVSELGSVKSNMPNRLRARTMNKVPRKKFIHGLTLSARKNPSSVRAPVPRTTMIVPEYTSASSTGLVWFFSDCLRKKLTVIGIIGKTHGVTSDTAPQKIPASTKASNPDSTTALAEALVPINSGGTGTTRIGASPLASRA